MSWIDRVLEPNKSFLTLSRLKASFNWKIFVEMRSSLSDHDLYQLGFTARISPNLFPDFTPVLFPFLFPIPSLHRYDQIWDPVKAKASGALGRGSVFLEVPTNKREAAMVALHRANYDTSKLNDFLKDVAVVDGSDWSPEERARFDKAFFRLRKDIVLVAKEMGKSINVCYNYYLATYKQSDHYRVLKSVCEEERLEKAAMSEEGLDACGICGDGGSLLICDGCEGEYHMSCLRPPLASVPEGNWECDDCVNSKFLDGRDELIRTSRVFVPVAPGRDKKRKVSIDGADLTSTQLSNDGSGSGGNKKQKSSDKDNRKDVFLKPSPEALQSVRAFAAAINASLTAPKQE